MKIACLMMQKNEGLLLKFWFDYHASLFGRENIYVFDNGSDDLLTLDILNRIKLSGGNVNYDFRERKDFESKGHVISSKIKSFPAGTYDFYFPLDCDEFVASSNADGYIDVDKNSIIDALSVYLNSPEVLMINYALDNSPIHPNYYRKASDQRKCFFADGACHHLDIGFHEGRSLHGKERIKTSIVYFHIHNRPFSQYLLSAREKLRGRVNVDSPADLDKYWEDRGAGFHLVPCLKMTDNEYYSRFSTSNKVVNNSFLGALSSFGDISVFFDYEWAVKQTISSVKPSFKYSFDNSNFDDIGNFVIDGWCFDSRSSDALSLLCEEVPNDSFSVERKPRPDVVKAYPEAPLVCGFSIKLNLSKFTLEQLSNLGISVFAKFADEDFPMDKLEVKKMFFKPNFSLQLQ